MKTYLLCLLFGMLLTTACNQQNKSAGNETPAVSHAEKETYKDVKFDNANDLVCGMPLSEGIGDTAHYRGKVYGFCSKGCKEKFAADPTHYLSSQ
ncbi:MAG TPA: YHS domain-containing protein [Bacteroidota bacterium]|nr:YHS domain-containing protein [Bacteroidota bacterium]